VKGQIGRQEWRNVFGISATIFVSLLSILSAFTHPSKMHAAALLDLSLLPLFNASKLRTEVGYALNRES